MPELAKTFDHKATEQHIYEMWEKGGYFKATRDPAKKPYTILLPPPNASGKMHTGNVLMIAIEDLLIRYKRMQGYCALWLPGTDHAGTETQITFERELKKQGKSRFDYDRASLYAEIWQFVQNNKEQVNAQIKSMGASVDWSRYKFTLDADVIETVCDTFAKLHAEGLVYKDDYIVNYCPVCGTTYADIEIDYKERSDPFYYMKYGPFTIATVRPETKFRDTALAVNPKDKRYKDYIGKTIKVMGLLGEVEMAVIPDPAVDPKFGTGIMKVTPAHDPSDFELGKKFNLPVTPIIDLNGRMDFSWFLAKKDVDAEYMERAKKYHGKKVAEARKLIVEDLKADRLLVKVDDTYTHSVPVCKAGHDIEPTILPNWFIKVDSLKKPAHEAVKNGNVKIYPKWQEIKYHRWMENMHDWAISRQNVWGIRIPVWYNVDENPTLTVSFLTKEKKPVTSTLANVLKNYSLEEITAGLQKLMVGKDAKYVVSKTSPGERFLQETDTFDTWFSSGQWPLVTLGYPDSADFNYFYPTSVLETGWEILSKWVSRMIMFGMYLTGKPPFTEVYLHGLVRAVDGRKMSKSLGNVVNPEEYKDLYGTDALRMGLISGTAGGKDFNFPKDKIIAYRNFANKVWNMARFMLLMFDRYKEETGRDVEFYTVDMEVLPEDAEIVKKLNALIKNVDKNLEKYRFADAADQIYHFMWDELAAKYIESVKNRADKAVALSVLHHVFLTCLKLLHPFMPFVTEEIWGNLPKKHDTPLIVSEWPKA